MTDYAKIAPHYDRNPLRHQIPPDELISQMLLAGPDSLKILDLACGTGNYLVAQEAHFATAPIEWHGVDLSAEMLGQARAKGLRATLQQANVENLPFADGFFDFIKIRFAHHHFTDQGKAFGEVRRVMKPGAKLSLFNICHEYAKRPWVYHYFPETRQIDAARFSTVFELHDVMAGLGFQVTAEIQVSVASRPLAELISEAANRDMSQLNLISDDAWRAGLASMRADAAKQDTFLEDTALLHLVCTK